MNHLRKMDLTSIYRTFHTTAAEYTFFSSADNILQNRSYDRTKKYLYKHKRTAITPIIFAGHNGMKIEINKKRNVRRSRNMWKLNNILLNNQWVKEEKEKKNLKTNEIGNMTYQICGMQQSSSERKVYDKKCIY